MKLKLKLILVLMTGVVFTYTACKKSSSSKTVDTKTVSSQVALNLAQTLYSGFGGFNITSGLNAPGTFGVDRNKIRLSMTKGRLGINDLGGDITCGMQADTAFNADVSFNGTKATVAGTIGFAFTCSNGVPSGFTVTDNLKVTETSAQVTGTYNINENLTIALLNLSDPNSDFSLNGTVAMSDNLKTNGQTTSESYNYTFNQVVIDQLGTIASGSANFTTKGSNASGSWNYSGNVVFLGNDMVKITINGTVYNVNLQTGAVS